MKKNKTKAKGQENNKFLNKPSSIPLATYIRTSFIHPIKHQFINNFIDTLQSSYNFHLYSHAKEVTCILITSDNKYIISGSSDKLIRIWNVEKKRLKSVLSGHTSGVTCMALSSNNEYFVSGSNDAAINLWTFPNKLPIKLVSHISPILSLKLSKSNKEIYSCSNRSIIIWDYHTKKIKKSLDDYSLINRFFFPINNGKIILYAGYSYIKSYEETKVFSKFMYLDFAKKINCIDMSTDESLLVVGFIDSTIAVCDITEKILVTKLEGHSESVNAIAISTNMKFIASGSSDNHIRVWEFRLGRNQVLRGHRSSVDAIVITKDDKLLVSGGLDKTIRIWILLEGIEIGILTGHTDLISTISLSKNQHFLITGSKDHTVRAWDICTKREIALLGEVEKEITCITFFNNSRFAISGSTDGRICVWDIFQKRLTKTFKVAKEPIQTIVVKGKYLAIGLYSKFYLVWKFNEFS